MFIVVCKKNTVGIKKMNLNSCKKKLFNCKSSEKEDSEHGQLNILLQLVPTVVSRKNFFHFMLQDENDIIKDQAHNQILHIKPKSIIKVNLGTSCLSFLGT